jgi:hypothetical protein
VSRRGGRLPLRTIDGLGFVFTTAGPRVRADEPGTLLVEVPRRKAAGSPSEGDPGGATGAGAQSRGGSPASWLVPDGSGSGAGPAGPWM